MYVQQVKLDNRLTFEEHVGGLCNQCAVEEHRKIIVNSFAAFHFSYYQ